MISEVPLEPPDLDAWLPDPAVRVCHRRESSASPERLWRAAQELRLGDTRLLGRLIRWRIPGVTAKVTFEELFRNPPFLAVSEANEMLISGLVGRIWTLRRDYPRLDRPEEFLEWSRPGTVRVLLANWVQPADRSCAALCSETRVQPLGAQGRVGLATVRPLIRGFQQLVGTDAIAAAVRRAEER